MKYFECLSHIYDIDVKNEQIELNTQNKNKKYLKWRRSILMFTIICYIIVIGFTIAKIVNYFEDYNDKKSKHDKEIGNLYKFRLLINDLKQYLTPESYYITDDLINSS